MRRSQLAGNRRLRMIPDVDHRGGDKLEDADVDDVPEPPSQISPRSTAAFLEIIEASLPSMSVDELRELRRMISENEDSGKQAAARNGVVWTMFALLGAIVGSLLTWKITRAQCRRASTDDAGSHARP